MTVRSSMIPYEADGLAMEGHLYLDDSIEGARPGVLVFPEGFGLSEHAKSRAERLAGLGYAALACDLYGQGKVHDVLEDVMALIGPLRADPTGTRARASAGLAQLVARPEVDASRIVAIGYCFGGTMALELARSGARVAGVVGFHSGLATARPEDAKRISGKVLVCIGADDPGILPEERAAFEAEMRAGGVDWRMHLYGGVVHGFTNRDADKRGMPEFLRYDAGADARSWDEMMSFFGEVLG